MSNDDYLAIAERMPADMQTIYMRGFPGFMNMDTIRNFFMENSGRCTFAFHKKSIDNQNLFIALRFDDARVAEEVLRRYDDRHVLGYRIHMKYFKDHKQAREIADDYRRDRHVETRPRDRNRDNNRRIPSNRRSDVRNKGQVDLRSDLNLTRERNRNINNNSGNRRNRRVRRRQYNEGSGSREERAQPAYHSDYYEQDDRQITGSVEDRRSDYHSLEEDDEPNYRDDRRQMVENESGNEEPTHQMHYPRSPSCSPPASPEKQRSEDKESNRRSRSRSRSPRNRHRHRHHSRRKPSRSETRDRSKSRSREKKTSQKREKEGDEKQVLPVVVERANEAPKASSSSETVESPSSPQKEPVVSNSTTLSINVSEYTESMASKVSQITQKESGEEPASSSVGDNPGHIPPEKLEALVGKKIEVVRKYQEQCETIASVANMFIREDPSASATIQSCMCATLRRLADVTIKEMDDFVKHLL